MWNTTNFPNAPDIFEAYTMVNITNPQEVLNGAKPILKEIGPFTYKFNKVKLDITYLDDGDVVQYVEWIYYNFQPDMSIGRPEDYMITNLNPPYLAILSQTQGKGEFALPLVFVSVEIRWQMEFLNNVFIPDLKIDRSSSFLSSVANQIITSYQNTNNVTYEVAQDYFANLWVNGTQSTGNAHFDSILLSLGGTPTGIPYESALKLVDPHFPFSLTNIGANNVSWSVAKWWGSLTPANNSNAQNWFGLTSAQAQTIAFWVTSTRFTQARDQTLYQSTGATTDWELSCLQWGSAPFGGSVSQYYPQRWPYAPEYAYFAKAWLTNPAFLSVDQCLDLTYGENNITWAKPFGFFINDLGAAMLGGNFTGVTRKWLITNGTTAGDLFAYIAYMYSYYGKADVDKLLADNNGLMVTRPASQWIWNIPDQLSPLFIPNPPPASLKHNASSPDAARAMFYPTSIWTGKTNMTKYGLYNHFRGYSWIDWLYPTNYTVHGSNEDGFFPPFIKENQRIGVFEEEYLRYLPMDPVAKVTIKGIDTVRYELVNATLERPNPDLANWEPGFGNLTERYNGTPVFLCNPHFFSAPLTWLTKIDGFVQNVSTDLTRIDIEPNTGKAIQLWKGVQINLYLASDNAWFNWYNRGVTKGVMYPAMIGHQFASIPDALVSMFTGQVGLALKVNQVVRWVFVGLGPFLVILAVLLLVFFIRRRRAAQNGFEIIN